MADAYTPVDGLKNAVSFPTEPADETAARKQIQDMFDQILAFHNAHLADDVTDANGAHGLKVESGTLTPVVAGSATAGANTYSYQVGRYKVLDSTVICDITISISGKDSAMAGDVLITGLPFPVKSVSTHRTSGTIGAISNCAYNSSEQLTVRLSSGTTLELRKINNSGANSAVDSADISNLFIVCQIIYEKA